jgi:DNA uptake protein ComE-like DNA-binding protein
MSLDRGTAAAAVEDWSATLSSPWSGSQKDQLTDQLLELSALVEPHLVEDEPISQARVQTYLLGRTLARLEDWLVLAAARQRRALRINALQLRPASEQPALGLRSASHDEVEALPGLGHVTACKVRRYLALHPETREMEALLQVHGLGAYRLDKLRQASYLDDPILALVGPTMWNFVLAPTITKALRLFESSDVSVLLGDQHALARQVTAMAAATFQRFSAFVALVTDRARLSASDAGGSLASEAELWLSRHAKRRHLLAGAEAATGSVLANHAYVPAARERIASAATSVSLMVFLGSAAPGEVDRAPLPLVEALEAAAARGVEVRVILDQDDGGEPYGSVLINRPLVTRLLSGAVKVKLDTKLILLHSKVLVIDREACVVGSHNWTGAGFTRTHELSVLVDNRAVASAFGDRFDKLWDSLPALGGV